MMMTVVVGTIVMFGRGGAGGKWEKITYMLLTKSRILTRKMDVH
jgi:hypothetical protein